MESTKEKHALDYKCNECGDQGGAIPLFICRDCGYCVCDTCLSYIENEYQIPGCPWCGSFHSPLSPSSARLLGIKQSQKSF